MRPKSKSASSPNISFAKYKYFLTALCLSRCLIACRHNELHCNSKYLYYFTVYANCTQMAHRDTARCSLHSRFARSLTITVARRDTGFIRHPHTHSHTYVCIRATHCPEQVTKWCSTPVTVLWRHWRLHSPYSSSIGPLVAHFKVPLPFANCQLGELMSLKEIGYKQWDLLANLCVM